MKEKYFFWKIILCGCATLFFAQCRVPYNPPLKNNNVHYLVVEGLIDGSSTTVIKLSRTRAVSDTAYPIAETNARVFVEDDHNNSYPLYETGGGTYTNNLNGLNPNFHYRLHIFTSDGKEYLSDFVPYKISPLIDSISWKFKNGGVQVYANTHDPQNNTHYYRWQYSETWEVRSYYFSEYKYNPADTTVIQRDLINDQVYYCWPSDNSSGIILGSTAKLSQDVVFENPLVFIPQHSERISVLYSILVTQFVLDTAGYNYWQAMKSNNENVGSIFDPQPNETLGNIHCVSDPTEQAVGYINAGTSVQKRIFISNAAMPDDWNIPAACDEIIVPDVKDSLAYYFGGGYDPINYDFAKDNYPSAHINCVDCTLKGTNIKPGFWP